MLKYKKKLGQHFLRDKNIIKKLVRYISIDPMDNVIEIGPGDGALSEIIAKKAKQLTLIEKDLDLINKLKYTFRDFNNVEIKNDDILKIDLSKLVKPKIKIIGNLPYNISTEILFKLLDISKNVESMYFMLQKEVVDRIIAKPNSKIYGRLSVMIQVYYKTKKLFDISPEVFIPKPKVLSSYIILIPKNIVFDNHLHEINFKKIVNAAFSTRRKMLKSTLKDHISIDILEELDIKPNDRAENLSPEIFYNLARYV